MAKISIIKVLLVFFIFFSVLFATLVAVNLSADTYYTTTVSYLQNISILAIASTSVQIPAMACIAGAMHYFLHRGYFNPKSAKLLTIAAYILLANIIINIMLTIELNYLPGTVAWEILPKMLFGHLSQLLICIGILAVADFIKQGKNIENENNLTI
ncbi:MAG: hypothetical protein ACLGH8_06640 [Bacteroidia bacterium]